MFKPLPSDIIQDPLHWPSWELNDRMQVVRVKEEVEPMLEDKIKWLVANNYGTEEEYEADPSAAHYDYQ